MCRPANAGYVRIHAPVIFLSMYLRETAASEEKKERGDRRLGLSRALFQSNRTRTRRAGSVAVRAQTRQRRGVLQAGQAVHNRRKKKRERCAASRHALLELRSLDAHPDHTGHAGAAGVTAKYAVAAGSNVLIHI